MGRITIYNKSAQNLDIWTSMAGPLQWNNNTPAGQSTDLDPGRIWVTVNAKVNSGSKDEIDTGKAIMGNLFGSVGFGWGLFFGTVFLASYIAAQESGVLDKSIVPESFREYFDAGAVVIDEGGNLEPVSVHGVYGNNNGVDVWGGELEYATPVGGSPDDGGELHLKFKPLQIREL